LQDHTGVHLDMNFVTIPANAGSSEAMSGLQLDHADPLFKRLARSKLPDAVRVYTAADVADERWSRDDMFCLDPIFWEVRRMKPGRWAKNKPKGYPSTQHLLDDRGRVLAMLSEYDFGAGEVRVNESLVQRRDGQTIIAHIEGATRGNPPRLKRLEWSNSEDGKPTLIEARDLHSAMRSRLFYADGRLVRIEREDEDTRLDAGAIDRSIYSLFYDALGRRERIESVPADKPDAEPWIVFQSKAGAPSVQEATARMRDLLRDGITGAVRTMRIDEPVWCVKLVYPGGGTVLPPSVVVCTQAKRTEILANHEPQEVWNQTLYPDAHQAHDLEAFTDRAAFATLVHVLADQPESKQIKLLRELAVALTPSAVESTITPTEDFGVVAVDMPHDDIAKAIRASVPKAVIKRWKANGTFP
jgi:hypothetical protein